MAAIEAPGMITRILLIGKLSSAALPFQSYFVFGHVFIWSAGKRSATVSFFGGRLLSEKKLLSEKLTCEP
jgi:hypothetical protein